MAYKYALAGPPFNFLGHHSETQKKAFYKWLDKKNANHTPIKEWYQIRAHQLRKTAGLLEEFYKTKYPDPDEVEPMKPTFEKAEWKVDKNGHPIYVNRPDQIPATTVSRIKDRFRHMLQRDDEAMFWMNWLRNHIERCEDKAQMHLEAPGVVSKLRSDLDAMFNKPEYEAVLVKNESQLFEGEPYYPVHHLDPQTKWQLHLEKRGGTAPYQMPQGDT